MSKWVTAVMVTGKDPRREPYARLAIEAFQAQTYPKRQLLIVTDAPTNLTTDVNVGIVRTSPQPLGGLRNIALSQINPDHLVLQWDDDDYYHPEYMSYMVDRQSGNRPVLLLNQLRYSLVTGCGFPHTYDRPTEGIPGAVLYPASGVKVPYQLIGKHEDSRFLNDNWGSDRTIVANPFYLYVRLHTGLNTWDEKHIMRGLAGKQGLNSIARADWAKVSEAIRRYAALS